MGVVDAAGRQLWPDGGEWSAGGCAAGAECAPASISPPKGIHPPAQAQSICMPLCPFAAPVTGLVRSCSTCPPMVPHTAPVPPPWCAPQLEGGWCGHLRQPGEPPQTVQCSLDSGSGYLSFTVTIQVSASAWLRAKAFLQMRAVIITTYTQPRCCLESCTCAAHADLTMLT